jgi:hypothetical protein
MRPPIIINYGGGTNSTALVIEAVRRGIEFDAVVMSDTGSEMPRTYEYMALFSDWLDREAGVPLTVVRWIRKMAPHAGEFISLHDWCESGKTLPSRAFGMSGCTVKWKQQPVDRWVRDHPITQGALAAGGHVERWLGYDADEPARWERASAKQRAALADAEASGRVVPWRWRAPLVEWDMGRAECVEAIRAAGLPLPGKSACWMCPSTKVHEIRRLAEDHPELYRRALAMEQAADDAGNLTSIKGLGQSLAWRDVDRQPVMFDRLPRAPEMECGCWDGDDQ